jgi:hypothetical protein
MMFASGQDLRMPSKITENQQPWFGWSFCFCAGPGYSRLGGRVAARTPHLCENRCTTEEPEKGNRVLITEVRVLLVNHN